MLGFFSASNKLEHKLAIQEETKLGDDSLRVTGAVGVEAKNALLIVSVQFLEKEPKLEMG